MEVTTNMNLGVYDITMRGQFTFSDNPEFRHILQQMASPDVKQIIFNMRQVTFVDSAALGMLLLALDESEKLNKPLIIKEISGQVKKMFHMSQFNTLFTIAE